MKKKNRNYHQCRPDRRFFCHSASSWRNISPVQLAMLFTVLKKGAIYALIAVSMNLLNGFTGLFSLGQAGFMLVGAYTYGVLTIPVADRANVYMYFNGGLIQFALHPIIAIVLAGVMAGIFCLPDRSAGAAAEERLSGDRDAGLRRDHPRHCTVGQAGTDHQRLQPAAKLSELSRACCSILAFPGSASP